MRGAWFAVAGDPGIRAVVDSLDGMAVDVADDDRVAYHAAAVIASNHLVALLGQVERIAAGIGVPLDAYLDLVRGTVDNVERLGPADALTGPVARGDWVTVRRHLDDWLPRNGRPIVALAREAARLVGRDARPGDLTGDTGPSWVDRSVGPDRALLQVWPVCRAPILAAHRRAP